MKLLEKPDGLKRIELDIIDDEHEVRPAAFRGEWLIEPVGDGGPYDVGVARTAGGRIAVWQTYGEGQGGAHLQTFDTLEAFEESGELSPELVQDVRAALTGEMRPIELDI